MRVLTRLQAAVARLLGFGPRPTPLDRFLLADPNEARQSVCERVCGPGGHFPGAFHPEPLTVAQTDACGSSACAKGCVFRDH